MDAAALSREAAEPPPRLDVRLLGGFAVAVDGIDLPGDRWTAIRATHLVQLLCLQPRWRASRDLVIDALWPQLDPEASAANLRKALYNVRQTLGRHDAVAQQGNELVLWPCGDVQVDADAFEHAAQAALQLRDAAACADAADLYTGDLLPGSRYEAWTEPVPRLQATTCAPNTPRPSNVTRPLSDPRSRLNTVVR